ncbi:MAG: alpha/beta hydrolase, partial [Acidobacteriota bacterium]
RSRIPSAGLRFLLVGPSANAELLRSVRRAIAAVPDEILIQRLRQVLNCDAMQALSRLSLPILDLRATNDRLVNQTCAQAIRALPRTIAADLPGPHLLLQRCPRESADVVARFVQGLPLDTLNR